MHGVFSGPIAVSCSPSMLCCLLVSPLPYIYSGTLLLLKWGDHSNNWPPFLSPLKQGQFHWYTFSSATLVFLTLFLPLFLPPHSPLTAIPLPSLIFPSLSLSASCSWLFWTDWGGSPKVERMSMDGTAHTTIISTDIVWPSGLAIDYTTHTLFWSDASLDKLESSDFDGQHRRILLERRFIFYPFGLAFFNSTLYWGDWVVGFVYRLSVVDPTDYNYVRPVLESEPTGLKVVSKVNQPQGTLI